MNIIANTVAIGSQRPFFQPRESYQSVVSYIWNSSNLFLKPEQSNYSNFLLSWLE